MDFDSVILAASTADPDDASAACDHADALEFRMDLAPEPLAALEAYDGELPILATNRAKWEGGEATDDGRLEVLVEATRFDAVEAIDVELASLRDGEAGNVVAQARERDVAVVASAHDFEGTPSTLEMSETLTDACDRADVGKLAVTAHDRKDCLAVLSVTHKLTDDGRTVATMAMGDAGSHTRAVAPAYGSKIGYAPVDPAKATAPGQYDLETLARLVEDLT
ncbi:type I 3-dehydroquinate dehydratase [Natronobacterium gregoryi]|uniref:3-dehydroquinate dehydratase n=2 Tax=Natronobacterium gregoryi TaxID=44930 RepID=L0AFR2_NATGS|nr:type I 3-dehydroquinate dehydratase [Natronobacterium gregoryi]AFZ72269.1 3-dehydroquinate dehydratase [Natronobacterium gregoryi SP2]ELY62331.1 3-dehydroquinate dehydratase [Natronobacterium gregoryi SP2]PLK20217.1 type I 3-dehydroquinate dehydratase [Natronobacterium gregoryi SP2]SFJ29252.1 3-dehydroquinate dehydratase [Natronobacterium gregoryi]